MSHEKPLARPRKAPHTAQSEATRESFDLFADDVLVEADFNVGVQSRHAYEAYLAWYDDLDSRGLLPTMNELGYQMRHNPPQWERMSMTAFGLAMGRRYIKKAKAGGHFYLGVAIAT